MGSFQDTAFSLYLVFMLWNIMLLGFGGIHESAFLNSLSINGVQAHGNPSSQVTTTVGSPYIAPTTVPEENIPFISDVLGTVSKAFSLISSFFLGASEAILNSGIPYPISWILSTFVAIFTFIYTLIFGFKLASAIKGGGFDV